MYLKQIPLVMLLILLAGPASSNTPGESAVDAIFAGYDRTVSPGCSMAVFRDDDIVYARGYGMANLEYGIANAPDTVFRIGSTSKQFTAMAMALLAEQGRISLDDDIHKFFPTMPDYGEPVTVRQLIHHTSGVRDYLTLAELADWGENFTVGEALRIITSQQSLNFPPGTDHLYSNAGYFMMSQIVEIVTGQSLREWAGENMFKPLGMTKTHFHDNHNHIVRNRADGYDDADEGGFEISMTALDMVGDGGIYTTVEDMLKWDRNFYDNKLGKGGPALIKLVETPGRLKNGKALDYAFGLGVGEFAGTREIAHGGAFVGFRAGFNRYPEKHLSVVVFCNYAQTDPTGLARQVAGLYLDKAQPDSTENAVASGVEAARVVEVSTGSLEGQDSTRFEKFTRATPAVAELKIFAGSYYSQELDYVQFVKIKDDAIVLERRAGPEALQALSQDIFVSDDGVALLFKRNGKGAVSGFEMQAGRVRNIEFVRQ